jgi:hypothetical protein
MVPVGTICVNLGMTLAVPVGFGTTKITFAPVRAASACARSGILY